MAETIMSMLKSHHTDVGKGYQRILVDSLCKNFIQATFSIWAYNVRVAEQWREESEAPRKRKRRREGTYEDLIGPTDQSET